jgi:two-component sensor histidine kinase/PAS domain-containing protein
MTGRTSTPVPKSDGVPAEDVDAAERLRATDWSQTALGSPDTWPPGLRDAMSRSLDHAFEQGRRQAIVELEAERVALRHTQEQLEFTLHAGRLGSWEFDIATQRFTSTAQSRAIFGLGPDAPFERLEDVVARVHPDDRERRRLAIEHAIATGEDFDVEYRTVRPDGEIGWILARGRATFENGKAVRLAGISLDITDRRNAEERQRLLLDELNHRVKNTLTSVQSIAMQTRRSITSPSAFSEAFIERIHALARAHDLLTESAWQGASLRDVISRTLALQVDGEDAGRVATGGPPIRLGPNAAVTLNMAFHELATNALKYGALSATAGRVAIAWRVDGDDLIIDWRETGGPPVDLPTLRGFGSRLIEQAMTRELGGEARLSFLRNGLWCHMRLPLSAKLNLAA